MQPPANTPPINAPLRPQLLSQPNPNPNNKVVQQVETLNMLAYSITPIPHIELHLQSRRVVEPIVIMDVPSPVTKERMNKQVEIPVV